MMERLKELVPLWTVLGFFATAVGALGAMSPEGSSSRTICYALVLICALIAFLALILEPLRRLSGYLGRGIRAFVRFARENLLVVAPLVTGILLLWRLFYFVRNPAVFSIISILVVACIAMTVGLIRLLARTRPSFLGLAAAHTDLWHYDFIDHFAEAEKRFPLLPGSIIEPRRNARCGEERMRAIFEHPPDDPNEYSTLTYNLTLAPGTRPLELRGFTGIMTELSEAAGPRPSQRSPENPVLFEIWINEKREYKRQKYASEWEEFSIRVPRQGILGIRFSTNCLGIAHFNWAAWGEPRLVEVTD